MVYRRFGIARYRQAHREFVSMMVTFSFNGAVSGAKH
jgi:hypothetical protein